MNKTYQELCDENLQLRYQLDQARLLMAGTLGIGALSITPPISKEFADLEFARRMERQDLEQRYALARMTAGLSMAKAEDLENDLEAATDKANDQVVTIERIREALGVPAEPHQGMPERIVEAAEETAAHLKRYASMTDKISGQAKNAEADGLSWAATHFSTMDRASARQKVSQRIERLRLEADGGAQ